jgi:flagellar biosynthetic protein FliQ
MSPDQVSDLVRQLLREALILSAPALLLAMGVSFLLSMLQTLTSLQDQTLSTVPRIVVVAVVLLAGSPWYLRHLTTYTIHLLTDLHRYLGEG